MKKLHEDLKSELDWYKEWHDIPSISRFHWTVASTTIAVMALALYLVIDRGIELSLNESLAVPQQLESNIRSGSGGPLLGIILPTGPRGGIYGDYNIVAKASDEDGVEEMALFIDDSHVAVCRNTDTCAYSWNESNISSGIHTIKVVARDTSGNVSAANKTISR